MDFLISNKTLKYELFINDVLKEQLKQIEQSIDQTYTDISELIQTNNVILTIQENNLLENGLKTKMDLGCNFYMQTIIPNPSKLFVDIGLGHFVELTYDQATSVLKRKINLLNKRVDIMREQSANTKAHIKLVLHGINELQNIK